MPNTLAGQHNYLLRFSTALRRLFFFILFFFFTLRVRLRNVIVLFQFLTSSEKGVAIIKLLVSKFTRPRIIMSQQQLPEDQQQEDVFAVRLKEKKYAT